MCREAASGFEGVVVLRVSVPWYHLLCFSFVDDMSDNSVHDILLVAI